MDGGTHGEEFLTCEAWEHKFCAHTVWDETMDVDGMGAD